MLSEGDLESMRATAVEAMPDLAVILEPTWVSDGGGGGSTTFNAAGTVACLLAPAQITLGDEMPVSDRLAAESKWTISLPAGTEVSTEDRLEVSEISYEILGIDTPRSNEIQRRCYCAEVT